jgi:hypothetical protein
MLDAKEARDLIAHRLVKRLTRGQPEGAETKTENRAQHHLEVYPRQETNHRAFVSARPFASLPDPDDGAHKGEQGGDETTHRQ